MSVLTLTIDGQVYSGWTTIRVTSGLEDGASDFDVEVTERWAEQPTPWQIQLFQSVTIAIDGTVILTGYVERYEPSYNKEGHTVRIAGRSKTCDIIDCMPNIAGSFQDQTLDAIANAMAAPFGISVVVQCPMGDAFPSAILEQTETAHSALEKLARMRSVLITDDANGNLVLTQAGLGGASSTSLVEGQNILEARATLACNDRYQTYVVMGQAPLPLDGKEPLLDTLGSATDSSCPRPRRFAEHAEQAADDTNANERALWRALHNAGKGTQATITVQDWYQTSDGSLWQKNQTVSVQSPMLELSRPLLVGRVTFLLDDTGGRRTELMLAPQEAFIPDAKGANSGQGSNAIWNGAQKITGS